MAAREGCPHVQLVEGPAGLQDPPHGHPVALAARSGDSGCKHVLFWIPGQKALHAQTSLLLLRLLRLRLGGLAPFGSLGRLAPAPALDRGGLSGGAGRSVYGGLLHLLPVCGSLPWAGSFTVCLILGWGTRGLTLTVVSFPPFLLLLLLPLPFLFLLLLPLLLRLLPLPLGACPPTSHLSVFGGGCSANLETWFWFLWVGWIWVNILGVGCGVARSTGRVGPGTRVMALNPLGKHAGQTVIPRFY